MILTPIVAVELENPLTTTEVTPKTVRILKRNMINVIRDTNLLTAMFRLIPQDSTYFSFRLLWTDDGIVEQTGIVGEEVVQQGL
jgi:hypothetical protein